MAKTTRTIKSLDEVPAVMKVQDVQDLMGLSKVTAYELVKSAGFPVLKIGKRLTIPKVAFIKWLDNSIGKQVKK